jgi:hypothetical protein
MYSENNLVKIDLTLARCNIAFIGSSEITSINANEIMKKVVLKKIQIPRRLTLLEFMKVIDSWISDGNIRQLRKSSPNSGNDNTPPCYFGIFKLDTNYTYQDFEKAVKDVYEDKWARSLSPKVKIDADLLDEHQSFMADLDVHEDCSFIIEIKSGSQDYKLTTKNMELYSKCDHCKHFFWLWNSGDKPFLR